MVIMAQYQPKPKWQKLAKKGIIYPQKVETVEMDQKNNTVKIIESLHRNKDAKLWIDAIASC